MPEGEPVFWPIAQLREAYVSGVLSPVDVVESVFERIAAFDSQLHSYLALSIDLARSQAQAAAAAYRTGEPTPPLLGVPVSIKDLFDVSGEPTTLGSRAYGDRAERDSVPVALLRGAGAVFLGKSNTAEFGQSATTNNLLGPDCGNPWDPQRTSGGSSGGAAASVGAGLATAALGSDGGGSIRIPAAMCGLFGLKPTFTGTPAHDSFHAMTEFVCTGPITRTVADARVLASVLLERDLTPRTGRRLRLAWCPAPLAQAVDPEIRVITAAAADRLAELGHEVEQVDLPLEGWTEAFGPLVLADEWRFRSHLLDHAAEELTHYVRKGIEAGASVSDAEIADARTLKLELGRRVRSLFDSYDLIVTPTTACPAFEVGHRPTEIDGKKVDPLWGPFPFTAPFNVSGSPAASLPVGLAGGLPVGLQVVGPHQREDVVLDLCEDLEESIDFPGGEMRSRWSMQSTSASARHG